MRIYPPDGGVEFVDFAMEEKRAARALLAVERPTRERDNKIDARCAAVTTSGFHALTGRMPSEPLRPVSQGWGMGRQGVT